MKIPTSYRPLIILLIGIVLVAGYALLSEDMSKPPVEAKGLSIKTWTTNNGARVFYVPATSLPMVDVRVVFDAGSARDGKQYGIAQLTNNLLSQGAGEWNAQQLAERFEDVGANFSTNALRDMAVVSLRSLTEKEWLDTALQTMATIIRKPRFDKHAVERERQLQLVAIEEQQQSPEAIAEKLFYKNLYGNHPYAHPGIGNKQSLTAIKREDLIAFHKQYYVGKNAIVAIVGNVDEKQAHKIANQLVGDLPRGDKAAAIPEPQALTKAVAIKHVYPTTQTHLLAGVIGTQRGDKDYFPLYVGNHILGGGGFSSRMMKEIREKRGLAYSAYSYFLPMRVRGPFQLGAQTRNEKAGETLGLMKEVLKKFVNDGPTVDELEHAKRNITGGFPLKLDSNKDIIQYLAMIGFYGLPLDYLNKFNQHVNAVTIAQIKDAFKRRVDPEKLLTVVVGADVKEKSYKPAE